MLARVVCVRVCVRHNPQARVQAWIKFKFGFIVAYRGGHGKVLVHRVHLPAHELFRHGESDMVQKHLIRGGKIVI